MCILRIHYDVNKTAVSSNSCIAATTATVAATDSATYTGCLTAVISDAAEPTLTQSIMFVSKSLPDLKIDNIHSHFRSMANKIITFILIVAREKVVQVPTDHTFQNQPADDKISDPQATHSVAPGL